MKTIVENAQEKSDRIIVFEKEKLDLWMMINAYHSIFTEDIIRSIFA